MRLKLEIDTKGLLFQVNKQVQIALNGALPHGMKYLRAKLIEKLNKQYYSLKQLRAMGHPYAKRRFIAFNKRKKLPVLRNKLERHLKTSTVRVKAYGRLAGKVRTDIINKQTGRLLENVNIRYRKGAIQTGSSATVGSLRNITAMGEVVIPASKVPYAYFVFMGKGRLIPRPVHYVVAKREMWRVAAIMEKEMQKFFDTMSAVDKIFD